MIDIGPDPRSRRRREAILGLIGAAAVLLALLSVFAVELSNTQAKSKADVRARVHERGVLAAALIDGLFQTVSQQVPTYEKTYGCATVSTRTMNANQQGDSYVALLDSAGSVIAQSRGFTAQAQAELSSSVALALVRDHHPYGLGNVQPFGDSDVIDIATPFPTRYGERILLSGFAPRELSAFLASDLTRIPGAKGAVNYLLDGNHAVLGSTSPRAQVGSVLAGRSQRAALATSSSDLNGTYWDQTPISDSQWKLVLTSPDGPLFASVSGLRKWVPWAIFVAFALAALLALALARRALRSADEVRAARDRAESINVELRRAQDHTAAANRELSAANDALESRARELARSNAELEQFASIASHDLQEPLRKVRTFTAQLIETESDQVSETGREYLQRAGAAAERMQRLIEDLLKFSRVATHSRPFEPVDLEQLTQDVLGDLESQVHSTGALVTVGKLPTIRADPLQMRQVLQNLISNALKFRKPGVTPEIKITATLDPETVALSVSDNGIGFDPKYTHKIFRVFERLHGRDEYPGTGIGLALCRKIAERHGGRIGAESAPGEGATFTVTLPLNQAEEVVVAPTWAEREREEDTHGAAAHV